MRKTKKELVNPDVNPAGPLMHPTLPKPYRGLTLDDYFHYISEARDDFKLAEPEFGLPQILAQAGAEEAMEKIISDTVHQYGPEIYSMRNSSLAETDSKCSSEYMKAFYSGHRIHPDSVRQALREAIELGLQTIIQLPNHYPRSSYGRTQLKALALAFRKSGQNASAASAEPAVRERLDLTFRGDPASHMRFLRLGDDLQWAATELESMAGLRLARTMMGSPNPQVRAALFTANWFEACTGRKHYERTKTLIAAAFYGADMQVPRWVDRLQVEAVMEGKQRMNWAKRITS